MASRSQSMSPKKSKRISAKPTIITPFLSEKLFGSSIGNRTHALPSYKEIGPPDLIHVSKYSKYSQKEEGQYHFITGVDLSSPTAPLAYLQMISLQLDSVKKHPAILTYCAYNSFSRCDIRIRVESPQTSEGQYQLQLLPANRSQKIINEVSDQTWDEIFISGIVRSLMINLDKERKIPALVEKQLFQSRQQTLWMISKMVELLPKGSALGAKDTVQKPSLHENFLVDALCYVVQITGLFQHAIAEIQKLPTDMTSLIATLLCLMDNEIEAVKYLYKAIKHNSRDPLLLNEQVKLLLKKDQPQLALASAMTSIKTDPLNFESWYWLTICYILNGDVKAALISLNSTPMFPQRHKDLINLDPNDMIQLPEPTEGKVQSVWQSTSQVFGANSENLLQFTPRFEVEAVDPALKRVNTNLMRGTHKMAYDTLILMINKIGWEQLLKFRAEVFIMDEEYKSVSTVTLHSQAKLPDIKTKRQCERWLDDLFLIIYDDLRITLIVENELNSDKPLKHSALEWELIGLTAYRTGHYSSCVPALRTTISANFDIISSMKLLKLWEYHYLQPQLNKHRWIGSKEKVEMSLDTILEILLYIISYNIRFYNELQLDVLLFLKKLCVKFDKEFIKNKIQVSFENDNDDYTNSGVIPPFDKLIETIDTLSHY